jgi:hypothetical protein
MGRTLIADGGKIPWQVRDSRIGRLDKGLDAAATYGWTVIDMAEDWKTVFAD